jgi:hypothetical protein
MPVGAKNSSAVENPARAALNGQFKQIPKSNGMYWINPCLILLLQPAKK